jgi:hypothetical protein
VQAVGDLAGQLHRPRTTHRADLERKVFLHGTRCRGHAGVAVEVALEVDRGVVEDGSHHLVRLAQAGRSDGFHATRRRTARPSRYCRCAKTTSARPPLNSSSVAASWTT